MAARASRPIPGADASPAIRHPAAGTPDKTAPAAAQIAAFVGTARPHFSLVGDTVLYSGPDEWSYRRMVLHQAYLAKPPAASTPSSSAPSCAG